MARLFVPKRVLVTPSALEWPAGTAMVARAEALGAEIVRLKADRLTGLPDAYRDAKTTMAVVTASPSRRRLQPIPPSADWRFDLAEGCPAHCSYCYLAGSLAGPPIIRAYANLPEILAELPPALGTGAVTSASPAALRRGHHFRVLLLHRPARPRAPDRQPRRLHHAISAPGTPRCSSASPPNSTPSSRCSRSITAPHPHPLLAQRSRRRAA